MLQRSSESPPLFERELVLTARITLRARCPGRRGACCTCAAAVLQAHSCTCSRDVCDVLMLLCANVIFTVRHGLICSRHRVYASSVVRRRGDGPKAPLSEGSSMRCGAMRWCPRRPTSHVSEV